MGARLSGDLTLGRAAHRGDDMGAAAARELHGRVPDRSRATVHEHGLAVDGAVSEEAAVGGEVGNAQCRRLVDVDSLGDRHGLARGDDGELRGRAVLAPERRVVDPHALADATDVDARTDGLDDAGAVLAGHLQCEVHRRDMCAGLPVGGIDGGDLQSHAHLADARARRGDLADREDVGVAPLLVVGRQHGASLVVPSGP